MHETRLVKFFLVGLSLGALAGTPAAAAAEPGAKVKDEYVAQVVTLMRTHVAAMRWLMDNKIRYSDNMVRHAIALERTFGMVGPMEWHAAEAFTYMRDSGAAEKLDEAHFEELAEQSHNAIHRLPRAAERYMRDSNKARMRDAINAVISSCGACHSKLPKGAVPDVWDGLVE